MSSVRAPSVHTASFLAETLQPNIYAACIIPFTLSVVAVCARFWCRWAKSAGFKIDDYLIVVALLAATALVGNALFMIPRGLGKHIYALPDMSAANHMLWKGWFVGEVTYTVVIVCVKFSILFLYWRTFAPLNIKWEIVVMCVVTFLWGASVFICMMLHCFPLRKYWDPDVPGECKLDNQQYLFAISIPNILIDVILLTLPVRYVMRLEMSKRHKQTIVALFLFGGFVCIASIMRLVSVVESNVADPDSTWVNVGQCTWAIVEANAAIMSACLPCLGPILSRFWPSAFAPDRAPSTQRLREWTIGSEPRKKGPKRGIYGDTLCLTTDDTLVGHDTQLSTLSVPEGNIKVKNEYAVETNEVHHVKQPRQMSWEDEPEKEGV